MQHERHEGPAWKRCGRLQRTPTHGNIGDHPSGRRVIEPQRPRKVDGQPTILTAIECLRGQPVTRPASLKASRAELAPNLKNGQPVQRLLYKTCPGRHSDARRTASRTIQLFHTMLLTPDSLSPDARRSPRFPTTVLQAVV